MALFNHLLKEVNAKIVYFGPGMVGKQTSVAYICRKLDPDIRSPLKAMQVQGSRILFFNFCPAVSQLDGYSVRFHLYTVTGDVSSQSPWKVALKGADGVIFVVDSDPDRLQENRECLIELRELLVAEELLNEIPVVMQYNGRDLSNAMPLEEMQRTLNRDNLPGFPTVASRGEGVHAPLACLTNMVLANIRESLDDELVAEAEAEIERKAEAERQAELEVERKIEAERQADIAAQLRAEVEKQAKVEAELRAEAEMQAKVEAERKAEAERQAEIEAKQKAEAERQAKAEAERRAEIDRQLDAELEKELAGELPPGMDFEDMEFDLSDEFEPPLPGAPGLYGEEDASEIAPPPSLPGESYRPEEYTAAKKEFAGAQGISMAISAAGRLEGGRLTVPVTVNSGGERRDFRLVISLEDLESSVE